jgi:hypothetical protein
MDCVMFEVGQRVRVRSGKDVYQKCMARGMVNVLAKSFMEKTGEIIETSEHFKVARLKLDDGPAHLSQYYVPHNVLEPL